MKVRRWHTALASVVGLSVYLSCVSAAAAQNPQPQEEKLEAAHSAFAEGFALFKKSTVDSLRSAIGRFETAAELFRQSGDKRWHATSLLVLGRIANDLGEKASAVERYKEALPLLRAIGEKQGEVTALNNIGAAYLTLGENQLALEYIEQSLPLIRDLGDKGAEARALNNIGNVYANLGDRPTALKFFEQSLPLIRSVNDKDQEATTLNNIGGIYYLLGENRSAVKYFEQALPLARLLTNKRLEASVLSNLGSAHAGLGDNRKALELNNEALPLRRLVGDREGEAVTLNNMGTEYLLLGEGRKALENLNQALLLRRVTGDLFGEAVTLNNIMGAWRVLGNLRLAAFYGKQSVDVRQQLRSKVRELSVEVQRGYLKSLEDNYRHLAKILVTEGRLYEAHQTLNALKDQQYLDFTQESRKQPVPLTLTPREAILSEAYQQAIARVGVIAEQLTGLRRRDDSSQSDAAGAPRLVELESSLKEAFDDVGAILARAENEFSGPPDAQDKVGELADTLSMRAALRELSRQTGQGAVAIYQLVINREFHLILVTPDDIRAVSRQVDDALLEERALQFWALLQSDEYDPARLGQQLYAEIFKPLEKELPKDVRTILWSLDGNLRYVPMAALHDGRRYLVERYNHVNFTRADSERLTRATSHAWTGTGFGSSSARTVRLSPHEFNFDPIPGVKEELQTIIRKGNATEGILNGEVLLDAEFTKVNFLQALRRQRHAVHIASHFNFHPGDEDLSFLLLGDGKVMTLREMKHETTLFKDVQLLTLSACNTAAQLPDATGREIDGFAELAQRLGADAILATLWPVADDSTPRLMRDFYTKRQAGRGMSKSEALREAQLALLHGKAQRRRPSPVSQRRRSTAARVVIVRGASPTKRGAGLVYVGEIDAPPYQHDVKRPFAHPYYWAPFVLFGNPR